MITEDATLNFISTWVSGTGFSASQFTPGLNLSSGSGSGSGFRIPAFPYAQSTRDVQWHEAGTPSCRAVACSALEPTSKRYTTKTIIILHVYKSRVIDSN